nr:response regulator [uncultured Undibacterium sp.]
MSNARILAIDDDDMILSYLKNMLSDRYDIITSTDPHSAIALAQTQRPDLILCDIDMPAMDGGAVVAALEANPLTAKIPFLYLTAMVSPTEVDALDGVVGGKPGIAKRASLSELIDAIDTQLLKS